MSAQRLAAMATQMVRAADALSQQWDGHAPSGEPLTVTEEMMRLTLRVVGDALFGAHVDAQTRQVGEAFNVLSAQIAQRARSLHVLPPVLPTPQDIAWRRAKRQLDSVVYGVIAERRKRPEDTGDLLSMLMLARDEDTGETMSDLQLHDEVLTMMVAGHETTATTLSWVWALLERHPDAEARLHAELDGVLGGRAPGVEDLPRLTYTRQVVEEAMRLYPPVYVLARKVVEDDVVCGFRIPAGSWVDLSPWATHRDPSLWERPDDFIPERFTAEAAAARPRFAYFPFSGGPRQCIGNAFALMEAQLVLAVLAQRFRLRSADPAAPLVGEPLITLRPRGGLPMRLERRAPASTARPALA